MIESVYFFLGIDAGVIIFKLKGVLMIIADIMRMSIGLIKLLLLKIENYENLGIENSLSRSNQNPRRQKQILQAGKPWIRPSRRDS